MVLAFLKNYSSIYFFFWCNNLQRSNVPSGSGCRRPWDSEPGHSDFVLIRTGEVNAAASTSSLLKVCLFIDLFPNKVDTPGPRHMLSGSHLCTNLTAFLGTTTSPDDQIHIYEKRDNRTVCRDHSYHPTGEECHINTSPSQ